MDGYDSKFINEIVQSLINNLQKELLREVDVFDFSEFDKDLAGSMLSSCIWLEELGIDLFYSIDVDQYSDEVSIEFIPYKISMNENIVKLINSFNSKGNYKAELSDDYLMIWLPGIDILTPQIGDCVVRRIVETINDYEFINFIYTCKEFIVEEGEGNDQRDLYQK